jgi:hypothetical protein
LAESRLSETKILRTIELLKAEFLHFTVNSDNITSSDSSVCRKSQFNAASLLI